MPPWLCKQPGGAVGGAGGGGGDELLKATKVARALMMMKTTDRDYHDEALGVEGGRWEVSVWEMLLQQCNACWPGAKGCDNRTAPRRVQ